MAYNKEKLYKEILKVSEAGTCFFIEDLCDLVGISKETFYRLFPIDSNENDTIKTNLRKNKATMKVNIRMAWYKNPNGANGIALYKLICSKEERIKLSQQQVDLSLDVSKPLPAIQINTKDPDDIKQSTE